MKQFIASLLLIATLPIMALAGSEKTLTIQSASAPVVMDWSTQSTMTEALIILNTQEGLFKYSYPSGKLIPAIAESVSKSKDFKTYQFKIRKSAKWSDGRPVYAQDFLNGWARAISPQSTSIYTYYFFNIINAREYNQNKTTSLEDVGIKAIDDYTLEVKLIRADPNWEAHTAFWTFFPVRKDLIERFGANWWRAGIVTSTGPFVVSSYELEKSMILTRNPHYPKTVSNVDRVEIKFSSDFEQNLKDFDAQKIQVMSNIPFQKSKLIRKRKVFSAPLLRVYAFGLNTDRFPVNDKIFRAGIFAAIDRSKLIPKDATHLKPIHHLIPDSLLGSKTPLPFEFNVKKAKELVKKSGVMINAKLKLQLITNNQEPFISIAKNIQSQLGKNLGINVEINAVDNKEYTTYMDLGEYKSFIITWTAKVRNAIDFLLPYSGFAINNRAHYFNEEFDNMLADAIATNNPKTKTSLLWKAEKFLSIDESVLIPICTEEMKALVQPGLSGLIINHLGIAQFENVLIPKTL